MPNVAEAVALARRVADDAGSKEADACDVEARWPSDSMRALQQEGLMGLVVPVEHGGMGLGLEALARVCETLGYQCGSTGLTYGMHCVGTGVIASKATPRQAERYLRPIAEGRHITTLALSEPGTGVHFYLPETRIARTADGYRLNGRKSFVTSGGHADSYVLSAQDPAAPAGIGSFSCAVVPNEAPGLTWVDPWQGIGMRGNASCGLRLEDVQIPAGDRLGDEGDQIWYVFHVVAPYFLMAMAGTYLGIAARALHEARSHLVSRMHEHTGLPLSAVDVLQHRIASVWTDVERARRLIYWAGQEADAGGSKALSALMAAKADVASCAVRTVNECMTLAGGKGYAQGALLERLMRDARAAHVMAPTTDVLLTWAGRALLGRPLLEE